MASDQPCYFWKLPQEIHDMIFELAYGEEYTGAFITGYDWSKSQDEALLDNGHSYVKKAFPNHKVNDFMVSKAYSINAAKAYFQAQHHISDLKSKFSSFELLSLGLFRQFGKAIRIEVSFLKYDRHLPTCCSIRTIQFQLYSHDLQRTDKFPWLEEFTDSDFARNQNVKTAINSMPQGLRPPIIEVALDYCRHATTPEKQAIWTANVDGFKAYIEQASVALYESGAKVAPRFSCAAQGQEGVPLYQGSHVCFVVSVDLPPAAQEGEAVHAAPNSPAEVADQSAPSHYRR